jgi:hypothetical protein
MGLLKRAVCVVRVAATDITTECGECERPQLLGRHEVLKGHVWQYAPARNTNGGCPSHIPKKVDP